MSKTRKHHYLSRVYLKRFTEKGKSDSQIIATDLQKKISFPVSIKNIAAERDFNQILGDGIDLNFFRGLAW